MAKYHITDAGNPAPCKATIKACPVGGADEHYSSRQEASAAYEKAMEKNLLVAFQDNETSQAEEEYRKKVERARRVEDAVLKSDPRKTVKPVPEDKKRDYYGYDYDNDHNEFYIHPDFRKSLPDDEDMTEYMKTVHFPDLSEYQRENVKFRYDSRTGIVDFSHPSDEEDPAVVRHRRLMESPDEYYGD